MSKFTQRREEARDPEYAAGYTEADRVVKVVEWFEPFKKQYRAYADSTQTYDVTIEKCIEAIEILLPMVAGGPEDDLASAAMSSPADGLYERVKKAMMEFEGFAADLWRGSTEYNRGMASGLRYALQEIDRKRYDDDPS